MPDVPATEQAWPADAVERRPIGSLVPYARNARTHSEAQVAQIAASMVEWGFTNPVLVDEQGGIIAGHGRVLAAHLLVNSGRPGFATVPTMVARGWTDAQKRAYVLADNKLALNAGWDDALLAVELADLKEMGADLGLIGFDPEELAALEDYDPDEPGEAGGVRDKGAILRAIQVSMADPEHAVEKGDTWRVGDHHVLVCASVIREWRSWVHHLDAETALLCPFPGPFVPFGSKAAGHKLVMVQPDPYVAGHLLDRYAEVYGPDSVAKVGGAQ